MVERRHRAVFADQLRSKLEAKGTAEGTSPSSTASPRVDAQRMDSGDGGSPRTESVSTAHRREDCSGKVAAPMLADVLVIGAWLPLASVLTWHIIVWFLQWQQLT